MSKRRAEHDDSTQAMPDVQASHDVRRVAIDRVGVKDVTYPMRLRTPDGGEQTTVASINMYVALPHTQKGTHMSGFLEVLNGQSCQPIRPVMDSVEAPERRATMAPPVRDRPPRVEDHDGKQQPDPTGLADRPHAEREQACEHRRGHDPYSRE